MTLCILGEGKKLIAFFLALDFPNGYEANENFPLTNYMIYTV